VEIFDLQKWQKTLAATFLFCEFKKLAFQQQLW